MIIATAPVTSADSDLHISKMIAFALLKARALGGITSCRPAWFQTCWERLQVKKV
jgi:hypothetical protein